MTAANENYLLKMKTDTIDFYQLPFNKYFNFAQVNQAAHKRGDPFLI